MDRLHSCRTVGTHSAHDDANGEISEGVGHGLHEDVNGWNVEGIFWMSVKTQDGLRIQIACHAHVNSSGGEVGHTGPGHFAGSCLAHGDGAERIKASCEGGGESGGHVLDDQNGHGEIARKKRLNLLRTLWAAGGRSHGDDGRWSETGDALLPEQ